MAATVAHRRLGAFAMTQKVAPRLPTAHQEPKTGGEYTFRILKMKPVGEYSSLQAAS
jgi:hypothetical protein